MTEVLDGRLARGARTRRAVVEALLALNAEGDLSPTAAAVASRAGVALRSVYAHFADAEALYTQASDVQFARLLERATLVRPDLPLATRVEQFCGHRAELLEWLAPAMRAAALREHDSPALQRSRARFVAAGDDEVRAVFARELATRSDRDQERFVHLLHLVAGGPAWETLRRDRGLSVPAATALLRAAVTAVLGPARGAAC